MTGDSMKAYYAIFFCLAISLHNLEEALWLPKWSQNGASFQQSVMQNEFHFAVIIITALAYLVSFLFIIYPNSKIIKWTYIGFLGSMIVNAFFPHLIATILIKTYTPGLITALLLNIPINFVILYTLHKQNFIRVREIIFSTVVVGILLLGMLPFLFTIGRKLIHY